MATLDDLADLLRLRLGQPLALRLGPVDLAALAEEGAAAQRAASERHAIRVEAAGPLVGVWDRARLARVLDNLLGNAVKYSPGGGEVVVAVGRAADAAGRGWAVLCVRNRGIGIPAADLPRIA